MAQQQVQAARKPGPRPAPAMWTYKSVDIFPAGPVIHDGLRWYARLHSGPGPAMLRACTKQGMRELITHYRG